MFDEYDVQSPLINMDFDEEIEMELEDMEPDPEELERELEETEKELALSQAQGAWLDGYLDAMDELEEEEW